MLRRRASVSQVSPLRSFVLRVTISTKAHLTNLDDKLYSGR